MGRGQTAEVGATRVAQNGYHYTKVPKEDGTGVEWRLTHHITAEKMLGRPLKDGEMVKFKDKKFKRDPYNPDGIQVIKMRTSSLRRRKAHLEERIREMQAELKSINDKLKDL